MPTLPSGITRVSGTIYDILNLDLGIARTDAEVEIIGDVISVIEITGELDVKLNEKDEPPIELDKVSRTRIIPKKFERLFFTNKAQAGKSATLYIGREASFIVDPTIIGEVGLIDSAGLRIIRWGRDIEPEWVHGTEVTAPAADTSLVSKTVGAGMSGYFYGFLISAGEANDFKINWTSGGTSYSIRIVFGGKGTTQNLSKTPLNEGLPADAGTSITITNVSAGSAGIVYQARLLYAEV